MCPPTVINTCGCNQSTGTGLLGFLGELFLIVVWWVLRKTTVLLVALAVLLAPAAGRGLRALYRTSRRRWHARRTLAVVVEEYPVPLAIGTKPHGHLLWSEINKESAR